MSNELEHPSAALGRAIADQIGSPETVGELRVRLGETFEALRLRDQQSVNAIKQFIQQNDRWSVVEEGTGDNLMMDAYIVQNDGSVMYIQVFTHHPGVLPDMGVVEYLKKHADQTSVWNYSPKGVEALIFDAVPGQDFIDLLRGMYRRVETLERIPAYGYAPERWDMYGTRRHDPLDSLRWDGEEINGITISLDAEVGTESVDEYIDHAKQRAVTKVIEGRTHGDEYYELHHELDRTDLTAEERKAVYDRMMEIQALNGYPDAPLDWRTVIPKWLDMDIYSREDEDILGEVEDVHVVAALRELLVDPVTLYLYERDVRTRSLASNAVRLAELTGNVPKIKEISSPSIS
jgi:hypothetical protein